MTYIKNCFSTIEGLPIGFHLPRTEKNGVKTLMGVKRFEVHFRVIFLTDHKNAPNREKIANASHDDIYVIICVKISSEGRRQKLSRTSAGKIYIICRRLSEKKYLNFLGWASAGKKISEGRRQDFLSDHKVFPNRPKKWRMLQMTTSI